MTNTQKKNRNQKTCAEFYQVRHFAGAGLNDFVFIT